jgi:phosphatidate cytidylyltransferase
MEHDRDQALAPPTRTRRWSDLTPRAASALVLVVIAIHSAREGGGLFVVVWLAASFGVHWEWQRLIGGRAPLARLVAGAIVLVLAAACVGRQAVDLAVVLLLCGCGILATLASPGRRVWASGGMLYAGLLVIAVTSLRGSFPFGARAIIWLFAVVWGTDCFAYFGGRLIGGPKIWPRVSPSKTWSGTLVGIFAGGVIGTLASVRDLPEPRAIGPILALSFAAAALSQAGDALESGIKRRFGVKDTSRLIPGHGGLMDRLDGFIAAAVFAFVVGMLRNGPSVAGGLFYWA